jgi:hypothetical protein
MKADINVSIEASQENRIAELKAAILASFRGSTTCQRRLRIKKSNEGRYKN